MWLVTKGICFFISKDKGLCGGGAMCVLFICIGGTLLWLGVGCGEGAMWLLT